MRWTGIILFFALLILWIWRATRNAPRLVAGEAAPEFELNDQNGKTHDLQSYRGCWLVLYFYPRDATPGCTREACNFRDSLLLIRALNADVAGVSVDRSEVHARFALQHHLPFPLLADTTGKTAAAYGALFRLGPLRFARRHTFIVTPEGRIARIFRQVNPRIHAAEVVAALQALQREQTSPKLVPAQ